MSEFSGDTTETYIAANRNALIGLLNAAEELPLFHQPNVTLEEQNGVYTPSVGDGMPLPMDAPEEINETAVSIRVGEIAIITAAARTIMQLGCDALEQAGGDQAQQSETEKQAFMQATFDTTQEAVNASKKTYALTLFADTASGEQIRVETVSIDGSSHEFRARELKLTIADQLVERKFAVSEAYWEGEAFARMSGRLTLSQTVEPIADQELREMTTFFVAHQDTEGNAVLQRIFADALVGKQIEGVEELCARYDYGDRQIIEGFVAQMQRRAERIKEDGALRSANPELALPSAQELEDFTAILAAARG